MLIRRSVVSCSPAQSFLRACCVSVDVRLNASTPDFSDIRPQACNCPSHRSQFCNCWLPAGQHFCWTQPCWALKHSLCRSYYACWRPCKLSQIIQSLLCCCQHLLWASSSTQHLHSMPHNAYSISQRATLEAAAVSGCSQTADQT